MNRACCASLALLVASCTAGAQSGAVAPTVHLESAIELALASQIEQVHLADIEIAKLDEEMQRAGRVDPSAPTRQGRCRELQLRTARLKQAAIQRAIDTYGIDVSHVPFGVIYSPHGNMRDREGATFLDRDGTVRVEIGDDAFASASRLGSTIAHEVEVHVNRQIAKGIHDPPSDEQGTLIQEVEAYDYELLNKDRFGLSDDELKLLKQRRASYYRRLEWENRKRVDEASYAKR
jgi:hypothetical protein